MQRWNVFLFAVFGVLISVSIAFWSFDSISSVPFTGYVGEEACYDSDGGMNTSVKGITRGADEYGGNVSKTGNYTDRCINASMVAEFLCGPASSVAGNGAVISVYVSCSQGCSEGICTGLAAFANTSLKNNSSSNISTNDSVTFGFPDPLSPESEDFFESFILEDFLTPEGVANAQPDLPSEPSLSDESLNESGSIQPGIDEDELDPAVNKLLLNLTVNMTSMPPRLIGRGTFLDKSLLVPQFLPNVRPDAGLYANCDFAYQNISRITNDSLPRGSSTLLYVSALSPSFKCPRVKNLDIEIAYRLVNTGIAEVYPDGVSHACRAPWYSPSLNQVGTSVVRTPFVVQRVIVPLGKQNRITTGTFVVPVRSGSAINFNHFQYTSPRVVYLEAFRGSKGDYVAMEFTLVRCVEGKGAPTPFLNNTSQRNIAANILEPGFFTKAWCKIISWFGSDYESCLYE